MRCEWLSEDGDPTHRTYRAKFTLSKAEHNHIREHMQYHEFVAIAGNADDLRDLARLRRESQRAAEVNTQLESNLAATRQVIADYEARECTSLGELREKNEQQALEIAELRHSLERVTEQRDELRKRLNDAHECINHWETQSGDDHASFATRTVRIDYYQPLYVKAEAEVADLKRQLHESHSPFVNMAKEQSEARARIADLEKQLAEAKASRQRNEVHCKAIGKIEAYQDIESYAHRKASVE